MRVFRPLLLLICLLQAFSVHAVERHAFVVGNQHYEGKWALDNPGNDAADMVKELRNLGYKIYSSGPLLDLDRESFELGLSNFALQLPADALALVYYAGHGSASDGGNYLIPLGANLTFPGQLRDRAISVQSIVSLLNGRDGNGANIILLDACRDSILTTRGFRGGLTRPQGAVPLGTFIGYAASEGEVAADGDGLRNGVYTGALLKALRDMPDQPIDSVHKAVGRSVYETTQKQQAPMYVNKFYSDVCFGVCASAATPAKDDPIVNPVIEPPKPVVTENKYNIKPWAIVLGAVVVGALAASGGSKTSSSGFTLTLTPPTADDQ